MGGSTRRANAGRVAAYIMLFTGRSKKMVALPRRRKAAAARPSPRTPAGHANGPGAAKQWRLPFWARRKKVPQAARRTGPKGAPGARHCPLESLA